MLDRQITANEKGRRLVLVEENLEALDRDVQLVAGTGPTVNLVNGLVNLLAVVQLLYWYTHYLTGVQGILYYLQFMNAMVLHQALELRWC